MSSNNLIAGQKRVTKKEDNNTKLCLSESSLHQSTKQYHALRDDDARASPKDTKCVERALEGVAVCFSYKLIIFITKPRPICTSVSALLAYKTHPPAG